ncbi:hypothetical protein SLEP1_g5935 [Rubroshorea leprosula]|uniref:Uncharacterized protein n=1 Tax=Rubroshorea leprosula TaxID=152421 RepID=A0AAV5I4B5_9ROSI|nr:hypothetical protein SLEP1_g5935 [Rubroshorea leprosula]
MAGREPILRVTIGPSFGWSLRRISSISEVDVSLRSHRKGPTMGMVEGPGGREWAGDFVGKRRLRSALRRSATETVMRMMNQTSIFLAECDWSEMEHDGVFEGKCR